ncbi:MAG: UvrD-helicase domain-containing protein [Leptospiraceae bacterium]|nr:UvrD-helicase domain-containing protein [Leptospiraceae bacterium]
MNLSNKNPLTLPEPSKFDFTRHAVIEASAGTGKTYAITRLVLELIKGSDNQKNKRKPVPLNNILLVTFTEKATSELKMRIRSELTTEYHKEIDKKTKKILQEALHQFEQVAIYTIHGFCHDTLKDFAFHNKALFDQNILDDKEIFEKVLLEQKRSLWHKIFQEELSFFLELWNYKAEESDRDIINLALSYKEDEFTQLLPELHSRIQEGKLSNFWNDMQVNLVKIISNLESINFSKIKTRKKKLINTGNDILHKYTTSNDIKFFVYNINLTNLKEALVDKEEDNPSYSELHVCLSELLDLCNYIQYQLPVFAILNLKKGVEEYKASRSGISFDDMIQKLKNAILEKNSRVLTELQQKYTYAFVDEFQDTDNAQWTIFREMFLKDKKHRLYVIGDPKQAIYSFRGADVNTYKKASNEMIESAKANYFSLDTNYRSSPILIDSLNSLFQNKDWSLNYRAVNAPEDKQRGKEEYEEELKKIQRKALNLISFETQNLKKENFEYSLAQYIAGEIQYLFSKNFHYFDKEKKQFLALKRNKICILISKRQEAEELIQALYERQIPAALYKEEGLFDTDEALQLYYLLAAIASPEDLSAFQTALVGEFFNFRVEEIKNHSEKVKQASFLLEKWIQIADTHNWPELFKSVFEDTGLKQRILNEENYLRKFTNYKQLIQELEKVAYQKNLNIHSLVLAFRFWRESGRNLEEEANLLEKDSEESKVQILTMHKSKGLEFPVVFIAGLLNPPKSSFYYKYHENNNSDVLIYHLYPSAKPKAEEERIKEDERLFYVAFTRARDLLYIPYLSIEKRREDYGALGTHIADKLKPFVENNAVQYHKLTYTQIPPSPTITAEESQKKKLQTISLPSITKEDLFVPLRKIAMRSYTSVKAELETKKSTSQIGLSYDTKDIQEKLSENELDYEEILPGSRFTGLLLHEILEDLEIERFSKHLNFPSFTEDSTIKNLIQSKIYNYAYYQKEFGTNYVSLHAEIIKRIQSILWNTFHTKLPSGFSLKDIQKGKYLREVSFLYHNSEKEFFTGSIDLVFSYQDKYYILDWKTDSLSSYSPDFLLNRIKSSGYRIQYLLYTLALYRWVNTSQKNPCGLEEFINNQMGGIYYIFLRAFQKEVSEEGIAFIEPLALENPYKLLKEEYGLKLSSVL